MAFPCVKCSFSCKSVGNLLSHYNRIHYGQKIPCYFCSAEFVNYIVAKNHVYRRHQDELKHNTTQIQIESAIQLDLPICNSIRLSDKYADQSTDIFDMFDEMKRFFMITMNYHLVSEKTSKKLLLLHSDSVKAILGDVCRSFESFLQQTGISVHNLYAQCFLYKLQRDNSIDLCLSHCMSPDKFDAYLGGLGHVKAVKVTVGEDFFYHVPLGENLKSILKGQTILHPDSLSFSKSSYFQSSILPFSDPNKTVYIGLYSDELEVCNPIGTSRGIHKISAIYFSILNQKNNASKMGNYHLASLCNFKVVKKITLYEFCKPIIDDLFNLLFNTFCVNDEEYHVIACFMAADNLTAHPLLGLQSHFHSGYICRHCYFCVRYENTNVFQRTHESYIVDSSKQQHGCLYLSPFLHLPYVFLPAFFPSDFMRDFLEGISHVVISTFLNQYMIKRKLTLLGMNLLLRDLKLPVSLILTSTYMTSKLALTASEMLTISLCLPLFLFDNFNDKDAPYWDMIIIHCNILLILNSRGNEHIESLHFLIPQLVNYIKTLYKGTRVAAKLHFITHYPDLSSYMGTMKTFWCMRFEQRHQIFKKLARVCQQFKNPIHLFSKRFQMHETCRRLLESSNEIVPGKHEGKHEGKLQS
ncbi:uncharacterized protein LOC105850145 isoform X2 [Hydra vulgaris]|uniref:Uncharacterized protein LOC105850145 isoform X2 n=1 Tax=Hydra vulgaris TaxID=6087 RepID=A0ABM4CRS6_HYDVU